MSVREGRLNDARDLMSEMVAGTRQEPGTQGYEHLKIPGNCVRHGAVLL